MTELYLLNQDYTGVKYKDLYVL